MSLELLQALARLHAAAAWLATVALIAAAWAHASERARRLLTWLGAAAAALALAAGGLGFALHDGYRARLRQRLFLKDATLGWLFERKLHLAFAAVLLAVAAAAITVVRQRVEARAGMATVARELQRAAAIAWTAAAVLALIASVASAVVARRLSF